MDSLTQLQNYLSSITTFLAHSLQHATHGAGVVSTEGLQQTLAAEHAAAEQERNKAAAATAAHATSSASASSLPTIADAPAASASSSLTAAAPALPDLSAPLYSGLTSDVEFAMSDRAHQLFKRVLEADTLIQAIPPQAGSKAAQREQLEQIEFMEAFNEKAGDELRESQAQAKLWQQRVCFVLQQAAACQLRTSTNQDAVMPSLLDKPLQ